MYTLLVLLQIQDSPILVCDRALVAVQFFERTLKTLTQSLIDQQQLLSLGMHMFSVIEYFYSTMKWRAFKIHTNAFENVEFIFGIVHVKSNKSPLILCCVLRSFAVCAFEFAYPCQPKTYFSLIKLCAHFTYGDMHANILCLCWHYVSRWTSIFLTVTNVALDDDNKFRLIDNCHWLWILFFNLVNFLLRSTYHAQWLNSIRWNFFSAN